ncbi:MAG: hypothetical protein ACT4ON_02690 [Bacteroidota bacterium]
MSKNTEIKFVGQPIFKQIIHLSRNAKNSWQYRIAMKKQQTRCLNRKGEENELEIVKGQGAVEYIIRKVKVFPG